MSRCFKLLFVFVGIGLNFGVYAQIKDLGIPSVVHYSKSTYKASTQNWSISQNENGFIYLGNNDGILEYDGVNWKTYFVNNFSVVRAVLAVNDTVYTGAFDEIDCVNLK